MSQGTCTDTSNCVSINHLSIDENKLNLSALVFPNPSNETINIRTSFDNQYSVTIIDLNGKILKHQKGLFSNDEINIELLPKGIYMLRIQSRDKTDTIQLIKQ